MCIFHISPDGFFWADRSEYFILLDRYVFRLFGAAADVYISHFPGWVLLSRSTWVFHSLGSLCFSIIRSSCWCVYFIIPRMGSFEQDVSISFSWIVMFSIIRSSCWCVYFIIPRMGSFEQPVSFPFSWIVMFSIIRSSRWYVFFKIPLMDSFEQYVSISFSWIVMYFDYSQQLLMCIFHNSPDGFFWAESEYSAILFDRYVFDYSQQLLI